MAVLALFLSVLAAPARAQQSCPAPPALPQASGPNIFPGQKEIDLGEAIAELIRRQFRIIEDDSVNGYVNKMAQKLVAAMPGEHPPIEVRLIDQPILNAVSMPGGRIYISRKLVAYVRGEGELAGVLSHELGHQLSHQLPIEMTYIFQKILDTREVGDRADIFTKFNQMIENTRRDPKALAKLGDREEPYQYQADQIALIAMAQAGYNPQAFVQFFDRLAKTRGKTGNWFSDFVGTTTPNQKRLREMSRAYSGLPAGCREVGAAPPSDTFQEWQAAVISYTGLGRKDSVHALFERKQLEPPLRADLSRLRFSPDGRYILAQDETSIYIATRDPLRAQFRIDAPNASDAFFSPDSSELLFHTTGQRVERWSVAEEERTALKELTIPGGCLQSALSPDGKIYACFSMPFQLALLDVETGTQLYTKDHVFEPESMGDIFAALFLSFALGDLHSIRWAYLGFSTDGRYFVGSHGTHVIAWDAATHKTVPVSGELHGALGGGFTFLGPDRILGVARFKGANSIVASFPDCKTLDKLQLGAQEVEPAAHGAYVLLRPVKDAKLGVYDLKTHAIVYGNKKTAPGDLYDDAFLAERVGGEVAIYELHDPKGKVQAQFTLPIGPLPERHVSTVSPDLRWLAFSGKRRGAVWDLKTNTRELFVRNFSSAWIDAAGDFYGDFPKLEETERSVARGHLGAKNVAALYTIDKETRTEVVGRFVVIMRPALKGKPLNQNIILEMHDVRDNSLLWSSPFPHEAPRLHLNTEHDSLILEWPLTSESAKDELKKDPPAAARAASITDAKSSTLLVALEASTGKILGRLPVDTGKGSFRIVSAIAAGDLTVASDSNNRTLVYSLQTGQILARLFGADRAFSREAGLLAVENDPGDLALYDLQSFQKRDEMSFSYAIALARFSADGKRLLILTKNQNVYLLDAAALGQVKSNARNSSGQ